MRFLLLLLLCIFSGFFTSVLSDTIPRKLYGIDAHYGFIIPHSRSIEAVSHTKPYGFGISRNILHLSYNDWQVFNAFWFSGFEIRYFNFQNPEILGYEFDLTLYAEPVLAHWNRLFFTVRGGAGLTYNSKIYDQVDNPLNMFFSTKLNFPLYVNLRLKYRIDNNIFLSLSGCYNHISNGGFKQPNKGMNYPTLGLGIVYSQDPFKEIEQSYVPDTGKRHSPLYLSVQVLNSIKVLSEDETYPEKAAFIYGIHGRVSKPLGHLYALNAGAEMIFDGYIKETINRENINIDYKRFALTFGQDFMFGKVNFSQYFGFYLYSPYKARNPVYQKYELSYRVKSNILAGVFLKAHAHVAELMGINFTYNLPLGEDKTKKEERINL